MDLVYTVGYRQSELQIYLLFEHKSQPDYWVLLQLLRYILASGEEYRKQHPQARHLPPVYPLARLRELLGLMEQVIEQPSAPAILESLLRYYVQGTRRLDEQDVRAHINHINTVDHR